jgi:glutathione peroxidase
MPREARAVNHLNAVKTIVRLLAVASLAIIALVGTANSATAAAQEETVLKFKVKSLAGKDVDLADYKDKVVLIVNVASKCGLTPQYEQLEAIYKKYGEEGLAVLGFPCNQFGGQEPGTAEEIQEFCKANYGVTFDLFEKIDVNGDGAAELYKTLTALETKPTGPGKISWNFEKFLVDRNGVVVARFGPKTKPDDPEVIKAIEAELAKPAPKKTAATE